MSNLRHRSLPRLRMRSVKAMADVLVTTLERLCKQAADGYPSPVGLQSALEQSKAIQGALHGSAVKGQGLKRHVRRVMEVIELAVWVAKEIYSLFNCFQPLYGGVFVFRPSPLGVVDERIRKTQNQGCRPPL